MTSRRLPRLPWDIEEHNRSCFIVRDNNGQTLAYAYFETESPVGMIIRSLLRLLPRSS